jgi:hypothetical protein
MCQSKTRGDQPTLLAFGQSRRMFLLSPQRELWGLS